MGTSVGVPLSGGTQAHAGSGTVHLDLQLRKHRGQPLMVLLCSLPTPSPMGRVPSQAAPHRAAGPTVLTSTLWLLGGQAGWLQAPIPVNRADHFKETFARSLGWVGGPGWQ